MKTTLASVTLLFLKLAKEQMDEMNALQMTVTNDVMDKEDGRKYKITTTIEQI